MKVVAVHQPNYFPWLGYFLKARLANDFIFHDMVSTSKQTYVKRVRILKDPHSDVARWLTVPVKRHASSAPITAMQVDHNTDWPAKHLRYIHAAYAQTPFFQSTFAWLGELFRELPGYSGIAEMNIHIIKAISNRLELSCQWHRSSELSVGGSSTGLNIALTKVVGGDIYLSGEGARAYQSDEAFIKSGIALQYLNAGDRLRAVSSTTPGEQHTVGLSVIDALMHLGTEGVRRILQLSETVNVT